MLKDSVVSSVLALYLIAFFSVNLGNVLSGRKQREGKRAYAEMERPRGLWMILSALGTLFFFAEALLFVGAVSTGLGNLIDAHRLKWVGGAAIQVFGLVLIGLGILVFLWSVVTRGQYSVSWEMPEDHALVTRGPYRYVRHPSYLGYFLMFVGLFPVLLSVVALLPLMAIPGYVRVARVEEELLVERFGEGYMEYMERTGRFLPRFRV